MADAIPFFCDSTVAHYAAVTSILSDKSKAVMEDNDSLTFPTDCKPATLCFETVKPKSLDCCKQCERERGRGSAGDEGELTPKIEGCQGEKEISSLRL